jgi:hypothetical protein
MHSGLPIIRRLLIGAAGFAPQKRAEAKDVPGPIASQSVFLVGHAGPSFISKNLTDSSTLPAVFD